MPLLLHPPSLQRLHPPYAGGHGTQENIDKYVADLEKDWNIIYVHQRPCSPATNMLDLGVWMAIQNVVEKLHTGNMKHTESLARTVENAWEEFEPAKLTNVWNR